jgi:hypothetical protein
LLQCCPYQRFSCLAIKRRSFVTLTIRDDTLLSFLITMRSAY